MKQILMRIELTHGINQARPNFVNSRDALQFKTKRRIESRRFVSVKYYE